MMCLCEKPCSNFKSSSIWGYEVRNDICSSWHFSIVSIALQLLLTGFVTYSIDFSQTSHGNGLSSAPSPVPEPFQQPSLMSWLIPTPLIVFRLTISSSHKIPSSLFWFLSQCNSPSEFLQSYYRKHIHTSFCAGYFFVGR